MTTPQDLSSLASIQRQLVLSVVHGFVTADVAHIASKQGPIPNRERAACAAGVQIEPD